MIRLLSRGWPVLLGAIVANAAVQAVLVLPFATPSFSAVFVSLFVASFAALVAAVALVLGQVRRSESGSGGRLPRWREWVASAAVVLAVALASIASTWLVSVAIVVSLIVLAGLAVGRGAAGFTAFRRTPVRAVALTLASLLTLVVIGPPGLGTLLAGFFITGWAAAALTWLGFGAASVVLLCAWTALSARTPHAS